MHVLTIKTNCKKEFKDITGEIEKIVQKEKLVEAVLLVFVPHTTAGITLNEGVDPSVLTDMENFLSHLVPESGFHYTHAEGNSDAHILTTLVGSSVTLLVAGGKILLGTWQKVFLAEFDGPRTRKVHIKIL